MKTIIEMAREAGFTELEFYGNKLGTNPTECLGRFYDLVTEQANARANTSWALMCNKMVAFEREACAKVCDDIERAKNFSGPMHCAAAIRARENT